MQAYELEILKRELTSIIKDIDSGNCHMSHAQMVSVAEVLHTLASPKAQVRTAYQIAREYQVSQRTLYNWERDGILPPHHTYPGATGNFWYSDELDGVEDALRRMGYIKRPRNNSVIARIRRFFNTD